MGPTKQKAVIWPEQSAGCVPCTSCDECVPYWIIALHCMLKYKLNLQVPDKAQIRPSQNKTDPPNSKVLHDGVSQELLTATACVLLVLRCLHALRMLIFFPWRVYTFTLSQSDNIRSQDLRPRSGCRGPLLSKLLWLLWIGMLPTCKT